MTRKLTLPDSDAPQGGARRLAPSAQRNAAPILAVLRRIAPPAGRALEIASGTGQHIAQFAAELPRLDWQPSDANPEALASIAAWVEAAGLPNLRPPMLLDAATPGWADTHRDFAHIQIINLLHLISGAEAGRVLDGVANALAPGGSFLLYGPFRRSGRLTSDGDRRFDESLKAQDPAIGYKDDGWVCDRAVSWGLTLMERIEMPANNLALVFRQPA